MRNVHRAGRAGGGLAAALAIAMTAGMGAGPASAKDVKVCFIAGKTGALEAYAKQTEAGFMMGLEYLTKGTMKLGVAVLAPRRSRTAGPPVCNHA